MKYRLKNKELQKKLDELFGHQRFSEELNAECRRTGCRGNINMCLSFDPAVDIARDRCSYVSFYFMREDIECFVEYNPKVWNNFPDVEPPEYVWMRCVMTDIHHNNRIVRVGAKFSAGAWRDHEGVAFEPRFRVDKFKPWDEEFEERCDITK